MAQTIRISQDGSVQEVAVSQGAASQDVPVTNEERVQRVGVAQADLVQNLSVKQADSEQVAKVANGCKFLQGNPGVSPIVEVEEAEGGHIVTITDAEGPKSFFVEDGEGGGGGIAKETDPTVPLWAKQPDKPSYTPEEVGALPASTVIPEPPTKVSQLENDSGFFTELPEHEHPQYLTHFEEQDPAVPVHNVAKDAHNDIRLLIADLVARVNALADSDDDTLDQMSEIVTYIKDNRELVEQVTNVKVSVSDIVDNLTTNVSDRPLSAAQGVELKQLIDAITVPTKVSELENDANYLTKHQDISGKLDRSALLDMVYPVGSIYMSVNSTDPSTFIGGTWERLQDRFLLGAGSSYSAGATGGSAKHNHEYGLKVYEYYNMAAFNPKGAITGTINIDDGSMGKWTGGSSMAASETLNSSLGTTSTTANPHHYESRANTSTEDSMPPYLAVYMWKRTA